MKQIKQAKRRPQSRYYHLLFVVVALLALYIIIPQLSQFDSAFAAAKSADGWLIAVAGCCIVVAVLAAASVYVCLAQKAVRFRDSALTQAAGMFVNRLLPAGIGGMGLSADFLYKHGHTLARAAAIVALNNTLTFVGHVSLVAMLVFAGMVAKPDITLPDVPWGLAGLVIVIFAILVATLGTTLLRGIQSFLVDFVRALALYRTQKRRLLVALSFALINTLAHATALFFCMQAFHLDLSFAIALLALTGGVAVASITPTPGGLFGSEAGITAVLVGYEVPAGVALAVALSYRLVSYWLPLIPGAFAFWYAGRKQVI